MPFPTTKVTLINRLNNDELAWSKFFTRYRTAISDIGKCKGLTPVECDELVQLVMIRFHHKIQNGFRYDQTLARFRHPRLAKLE